MVALKRDRKLSARYQVTVEILADGIDAEILVTLGTAP
jgi:hypothetical protein